MKRSITTLTFLLLLHLFIYGQTRSVLFLGNSYTYSNNLPQMVADVAGSVGDQLMFDSNTQGGYYLWNHLSDTASLAKIMNGNWDYVVLQDQSLSYAYPSTYLNMIPAAYQLDSLIKIYNPCAQTMFYITWGRKPGDTYLCTPPECPVNTWITRNYFEMDSTIQSNYMVAVDSIDALASPVGAVWRGIRLNYPGIELFQPDESHPSLEGTYAAACCFYAALFRKNPVYITFNPGLPPTDAAAIRAVAKQVVYDSLSVWHIGEFDSTLNAACPVNVINDSYKNQFWHIHPNPASTDITISFNSAEIPDEICIYNVHGSPVKKIKTAPVVNIKLNELSAGFYFIHSSQPGASTLKFVKY